MAAAAPAFTASDFSGPCGAGRGKASWAPSRAVTPSSSYAWARPSVRSQSLSRSSSCWSDGVVGVADVEAVPFVVVGQASMPLFV